MTSEQLEAISNAELRIDEYPFTIRLLSEDDGGGYLIEFPDVPNCISDGDTPEEAIRNGRDALRSVLLTKLEYGDPTPQPGSSKLVSLPSELGERLDDQAQRRGVAPQALAAELISNALREPAA
jgi:antitoxin HicB